MVACAEDLAAAKTLLLEEMGLRTFLLRIASAWVLYWSAQNRTKLEKEQLWRTQRKLAEATLRVLYFSSTNRGLWAIRLEPARGLRKRPMRARILSIACFRIS